MIPIGNYRRTRAEAVAAAMRWEEKQSMTHDARIAYHLFPKRRRPYGWSCPCGKERFGYTTGAAAKKAAIAHNGGFYNEATSEGEEDS
jgi:hypothetical protein